MISFELAKQLKDAGFPREVYYSGSTVYPHEESPGWSKEAREHGMPYEAIPHAEAVKGYVVPTLSELIQACEVGRLRAKEPHFTLSFFEDEWTAFIPNAFSKLDLLEGFMGKGSDPETAVANLWLPMHPHATVRVHANGGTTA